MRAFSQMMNHLPVIFFRIGQRYLLALTPAVDAVRQKARHHGSFRKYQYPLRNLGQFLEVGTDIEK